MTGTSGTFCCRIILVSVLLTQKDLIAAVQVFQMNENWSTGRTVCTLIYNFVQNFYLYSYLEAYTHIGIFFTIRLGKRIPLFCI